MLILNLNLFYTMFIMHAKVFSSPKEQRIEVFNEVVTIFTIILLSAFLTTDFIIEADARSKVSFALMGLICINFLVTLVIIVAEVIHSIKLKCLQRQNRKKHELTLLGQMDKTIYNETSELD